MGIPLPVLCSVLVADGLHRAMMNTGQALFAVVLKIGLLVLIIINVVYRTDFLADTAMSASVRHIEMLIHARGKMKKPLVDQLFERFDFG